MIPAPRPIRGGAVFPARPIRSLLRSVLEGGDFYLRLRQLGARLRRIARHDFARGAP